MDIKIVEEKVTNLVEPIVEGFGLELVDVEYLQDGGYWFLRVYIEKESGIGLEECAKVSRSIDEEVDRLVEGKFFLEVSSPGLERPLKKERDFIRFVEEEVNIKLKHKINGKKRVEGKLLNYNESLKELLLLIDGEEWKIPFKEVEKAKIVFKFNDKD